MKQKGISQSTRMLQCNAFLTDLIKANGFCLKKTKNPAFIGGLTYHTSKIIEISNAHSMPKWRYTATLAHELCHILQMTTNEYVKLAYRDTSEHLQFGLCMQVEVEADLFSHYVLLFFGIEHPPFIYDIRDTVTYAAIDDGQQEHKLIEYIKTFFAGFNITVPLLGI